MPASSMLLSACSIPRRSPKGIAAIERCSIAPSFLPTPAGAVTGAADAAAASVDDGDDNGGLSASAEAAAPASLLAPWGALAWLEAPMYSLPALPPRRSPLRTKASKSSRLWKGAAREHTERVGHTRGRAHGTVGAISGRLCRHRHSRSSVAIHGREWQSMVIRGRGRPSVPMDLWK